MNAEIGTEWAERYRIEGILGAGGIGTVYRATDILLDGEQVALKVVHSHLASDQSQQARFITEVKLSRKVSHLNVVRTLDFGVAEGIPFFAMELVEGTTLKDLCTSSPLPFLQVCDTLVQIFEGLQAIHDAQILHRDLKSANLYVNHHGVVKIGDFGVACSLEQKMLTPATISGSTRYLAPEVWECRQVDYRADLYALGILSYELCTGRVPITAESAEELMCKHLSDVIPPLEAVRPEIPRWFSELIVSLLEKNSADRPSSAREVVNLIKPHISGDRHLVDKQNCALKPLLGDTLPSPPQSPKPPAPQISAGYPRRFLLAKRATFSILLWFIPLVTVTLVTLSYFFR